MTWWRWPTLAAQAMALTIGVVAGTTVAHAQNSGGPPFAGDPDKKTEKPRPALRSWTVNAGGFSYSLDFNPGIPNPGQTVEIIISVARIPKTPHPRFGNRIPQGDARFVVEMRTPDGELVGRYRAHPLPLTRGRYGLHFTPTSDGLFGLTIEGKSSEGLALRASTKLPVNVWPLPEDLQGTGDDAGSFRRRRPLTAPGK